MRLRILIALAAAALVSGALRAQQPAASASQVPDISGIWTRLDLGGGGSYGGVSAQFPRAELLPAAAAKVPKPVAEEDLNGIATTILTASAPTGRAYLTPDAAVALARGVEPEGRCGVGGAFGTGIDIDSTAMALVQSKDEVLLTRDSASGGRRIYLDGRKHPANLLPNVAGHSIGHWENGTLVVHTIGLSTGVVAFGRGWREPTTELTEVFKPSAEGKQLTITYTWADPTVYVKPHVYSITFEHGKPSDYILERWCDASIPHPETYTSIVPPVQLPDQK